VIVVVIFCNIIVICGLLLINLMWIMMTQEEIVKLAYQHTGQLKAYIYSLCYDWSSVDDIMQEALVSLMKSADKFDQERNFLSWALTIARRRTIDFQRRQKREKLLFTDDVYEQLEHDFLAMEKDEPLNHSIHVLHECLNLLSDDNRRIMEMKYFYKSKVEDICKKYERSFLAVQSLLDRLRKKLKQCVIEKNREA
jgi:RNA polymerase sigma-70 factor, ECF subfamily